MTATLPGSLFDQQINSYLASGTDIRKMDDDIVIKTASTIYKIDPVDLVEASVRETRYPSGDLKSYQLTLEYKTPFSWLCGNKIKTCDLPTSKEAKVAMEQLERYFS